MSETSYVNATVAVVGNPTSNKGKGTEVGNQVIGLLREAGRKHGFNVIDVTGESFEGSLLNARNRRNEYDYLVVVGGDGMIALGANAVGCSGKPLGIVATGSGNDFARGLELPVNRVQTAVDGIVGAIVRGTHIDVDMGLATSLQGGYAVDSSTGDELVSDSDVPLRPAVNRVETAVDGIVGAIVRGTHIDVDMGLVTSLQGGYAVDSSTGDDLVGDSDVPLRPAVNRFYAGMLSCGLDASINDRANHSRLPNGSVRYFVAAIVELTHMKRYGYHIKATLADGTVEERDIISPLLTVANSRHIGGGIEISPYSRFSDGLLDLVWLDHVPNVAECADAVARAYSGKILGCKVFGWKRVRDIEITRAQEGDEPPVLMADGEYVGRLPVKVVVQDRALRVLVPPAVAESQAANTEEKVLEAIKRDHRDPVTGKTDTYYAKRSR